MSGAEDIYALLIQKQFTLQQDCVTDLLDRATVSSGDFQAVYQQGRKDRVLCRLWEMKKITEDELIGHFLAAKDIVFYKPRYTISAPHFVFRIQQKLLTLPQFAEANLTYEQLSQ